jgi:hypothetical protein
MYNPQNTTVSRCLAERVGRPCVGDSWTYTGAAAIIPLLFNRPDERKSA